MSSLNKNNYVPIERRIHHPKRNFCKEWPKVAVFLLMLVVLLVNHTVFGLPGQGRFMPWLVSGGVFCWAMFNPGLWRWWQVFAFGLLQDFILGTPIGLSAIGLLIIYRFTIHQRRYLLGKPFRVVWVGYAVLLSVAMLAQTAIMFVLGAPPHMWLLVSWGMSILFFPAVHTLMRSLWNRITTEL